jgi:hypothetical protein
MAKLKPIYSIQLKDSQLQMSKWFENIQKNVWWFL